MCNIFDLPIEVLRFHIFTALDAIDLLHLSQVRQYTPPVACVLTRGDLRRRKPVVRHYHIDAFGKMRSVPRVEMLRCSSRPLTLSRR